MPIRFLKRHLAGPAAPLIEEPAAEPGVPADLHQEFAEEVFDAEWYVDRYPDVAEQELSPSEHFFTIGWKERRDPCADFWTAWYLETYRDIEAAGVNPLLHYLEYGHKEGRNPSPVFDTKWYAAQHPEVERGKIPPLLHYVKTGKAEGWAASEAETLRLFADVSAPFRPDGFDGVERLVRKLQAGATRGLTRGAVGSVHDYAESRDLPLRDLAGHGLDALLPSGDRELSLFSRAPYVAFLRDVAMFPGSATLAPEDKVLLNDEIDFLWRTMRYDDVKLWATSYLRGGTLLNYHPVEVTKRIPKGIHLTKEYDLNYFHFVFEVLPRLVVLEMEGRVPPDYPLLVSDALPGSCLELLDLFKHPDRKVLRLKPLVPYHVGDLVYVSDLTRIPDMYDVTPDDSHANIPRKLLGHMAATLKEKMFGGEARRKRRLYLVRSGGWRVPKNQADMIDLLLARGFEITSIEALGLSSQIRLLHEAEIVVAPTGAALTNLLWCEPGSRVLILYPDHPHNNYTFWNATGDAARLHVEYALGARTGDITGKYSIHDSYEVDLEEFAAQLDRLIGETSTTSAA